DRYNMRRLVSLTANVEGEDLGRVGEHLAEAIPRVSASLWVPYENADGEKGWRDEISKEVVDQEERPNTPPRGMQGEVRGQVTPMQAMFGPLTFRPPWAVPVVQWFQGLSGGLILAVAVIYLLLTAYFQSPRLALVVVATIPLVLAGVFLALFVTRTTLNLQSFMGSIMAGGVGGGPARPPGALRAPSPPAGLAPPRGRSGRAPAPPPP